MKKSELKKEFEKEFKNILLSKELKTKTINLIKTIHTNKSSHLPYLRNFAAIFVVTLICLSIYITNNMSSNNNITTYNVPQEEATLKEQSIENNVEAKSNNTLLRKSTIKSAKSEVYYGTTTEELASPPYQFQKANSLNNFTLDSSISDNLEKTESIYSLSEDEFLAQHPEAEKNEKGYIIYENEQKTLYVFKNNNLENIMIIE